MTQANANTTAVKTIEVSGRKTPPNWAVKQRYLIDLMNRAADVFVDRYTRPDGTLVWRKEWPGMDGSDDGYESFLSFPLFYVLGGSEHIHQLGRRQWNAVTWQFTEYGQVHREFDAYYDWMHHGESYTYLHYFGLADPCHHVDRTRALRFAGMYIGEDPEAENWDPQLKMIRSPINGSRGPCFEMTAEDWVTHRPVLTEYLTPYEDVAGVTMTEPGMKLSWTDDEMFGKILKLMNQRMVPGDVPLNLCATSLVAAAFLYTGDNKYRQWVLDYLQAWKERTDRNNGIMPDNIGPTGKIGELMDGKWWGGYYGWRWPHGGKNLLEATLIAGTNALMLTGDNSWLDLHRSQHEMLWSLRQEQQGETLIPARHGDTGWFDYRSPNPHDFVHTYFMTQDPRDLARLQEQCPDLAGPQQPMSFGKAGGCQLTDWFTYIQGNNPGYPEKALDDTHAAICQRLENIENDDDDVEQWDVHHWQNLNPVIPEAIIQMAMGTPAAVYHGGMLHASVRYFDPARRRSGLAEHVAALVEKITSQGIELTLVNTDVLESREVLIQAGSFGEHEFTEVVVRRDAAPAPPVAVNSRYLKILLGPAAQAHLKLGVKRYAHVPSYQFPTWGQSPLSSPC